jgi:signal transduction histidine kinase
MQESERVKLARSLHDGIAQDLVGLSYRLQSLLADESLALHIRAELRESIFEISQLSSKVRDEIFALRHSPDHIHISELELGTTQFSSEISIFFRSHLNRDILIHNQLLTICQELIRNAIAHAGATRIEISLDLEKDGYKCVVHDDGAGKIAVRDGHYGLVGIQELLTTIGGELAFDQEGSRRITLTFPNIHSS